MASVLTAKGGRGGETKRPILVIAQQQHGREVYRVDSAAAHDLLRTLGLLVKKRGPDYPVIVLLDWNSPVSGIFDVPAIASKAGFKNVRVFVFDSRDKRYMSEIRSEPGVPFSENP